MARSEPNPVGIPPFSAWSPAHPGVALATFADAAADGELIVNATAGSASLAVLRLAGSRHLAGKILVDVANVLDFSHGMPPTLFVKDTDSLAEQIQREFSGTKARTEMAARCALAAPAARTALALRPQRPPRTCRGQLRHGRGRGRHPRRARPSHPLNLRTAAAANTRSNPARPEAGSAGPMAVAHGPADRHLVSQQAEDLTMNQNPSPTVCLTFDFDAISVWLASFGADTPTAISRGEFGARVGVPRILRLLAREQITATFYIPGHTVDSFPEEQSDSRDRSRASSLGDKP